MNCRQCGKALAKDEQFCAGCGLPAGGANTVGSQPAGQVVHVHTGASRSNTMAVLGLVFAFIMPLLGLIFSCIGLGNAKRMNGEGRGLAIAGLVISILWIVLAIVMVIVVVAVGVSFVDNWM